MIVFGISTADGDRFMPEYKSGKGYSFWLADEKVSNQKDTPRLFPSEAKAKKSISEWAKGVWEWRYAQHWDGQDKRVLKDLGRTKDMLRVVKYELKELE